MAYEMRAVNNAMRRASAIVTRGGGLSLYGPTINIIRDGRWGRNQESVSEDPWLTGKYAESFVKGVQYGDGDASTMEYLATAATCKHLAAYSQETNRHDSNARVSTLDMMETYLPQFEACVSAGAAQVMCSYNKINGVPACLLGKLHNRILRDQWHFRGSSYLTATPSRTWCHGNDDRTSSDGGWHQERLRSGLRKFLWYVRPGCA